MPKLIFEPNEDFVEKSYMTDYRRYVNGRFRLDLKTYDDLHEFSITRPNDFWMSLWSYLPIRAYVQPTRAVDESIPIDEIPQFYEGSRLNYTENMLARSGPGIAVTSLSEETLDEPVEVSWDELREKVRILSDALRSSGLRIGDVICVVGGSNAKSLVLVLACGAIGGIVASFATDAGERVLLDRIGQLRPRLLFAEPAYRYNGKYYDIASRIQGVWSSVERPEQAELVSMGDFTPPGWTSLDDFLRRSSNKPLEFVQVSFHTPLAVMFSSGTTGTPKGIVHSHGGLVVNGMKEHLLHYNHDESAVHYHYAGIGWTLWNIMIGALFCGTQIVLYDGSPFYPTPERFLKAVLGTGVTSFGAGPRYFSELQKLEIDAKPYTQKLNKIPSAGALLTETLSLWVQKSFGNACQISTSGGTELCGNFVHGTQTLPVYAGENAVKCLGMDVDIFRPDGRPVPDGESGELVCKKPFPNMPAMFWNDPNGRKYQAAYFEGFPHVWTHGDFIRVNPETKGLTILGRSDGVLNPSGIRFGAGEIYAILERVAVDDIVDSICAGQQRERDSSERVFLFLQLRATSLTPDLQRRIRDAIATDLSRRHVPQFIFAVPKVPYNVNGKKLEIPLRAVLSEGERVFARRKFTAEEQDALKLFLPFFNVEEMLNEKPERDKGAKL